MILSGDLVVSVVQEFIDMEDFIESSTCEVSKFNITHYIKYKIKNYWSNFKYITRITPRPKSNVRLHAEREFEAAGYNLNDIEEGPNKWIMENVFELLEVFEKQGHSGGSASYCIDYFSVLANFELLVPLFGFDSEWADCSLDFFQNKRCSHIFKSKKTGFAYDIDGYVFKDQSGCTFTSRESKKLVTFPYTPEKQYVDVISRETNKEGSIDEPGSGWWKTTYPEWIVEESKLLEKYI